MASLDSPPWDALKALDEVDLTQSEEGATDAAESRILVVEDGRTQAFKLRSTLESAGFEIEVSDTGEDALRKVDDWKPSLVLLDVNLPDLDGREVARRMKSDPLRAGIPVVFMTGVFRDIQDVIRGLDEGADDYLLKPINDAELVSRVRACLRSKRTSVKLLKLARQLVLVSQMGRQLAGILEPRPLLELVVSTLKVQFGYDHAHVLLRAGNELTVAAGTQHVEGEAAPRVGLEDKESLAAECFRRGAVVLAEAGQPGARAITPGSRHAVALPLTTGGEGVGVLELDAASKVLIEGREMLVLQLLADLVAVAVSNARVHRGLQLLASRDDLTGCFNRRALLEQLDVELRRAARYKRVMSVMCLDIDRFKQVNDTQGHQVGDNILREVSRAMIETLRSHDVIGRVGGDEFLIVLPETDDEGATRVAERLLVACRGLTFADRNGANFHVCLSIGYAVFPAAGLEASQLIRVADEALYRAKAAGRDRFSR